MDLSQTSPRHANELNMLSSFDSPTLFRDKSKTSRRLLSRGKFRGSFGEVRVMEFRHMTRRVATSEARPPTRHEQVQWIKYSLHEKQRFVYMTFFELDLNTLLHISQANLLYLHTPYTMGS